MQPPTDFEGGDMVLMHLCYLHSDLCAEIFTWCNYSQLKYCDSWNLNCAIEETAGNWNLCMLELCKMTIACGDNCYSSNEVCVSQPNCLDRSLPVNKFKKWKWETDHQALEESFEHEREKIHTCTHIHVWINTDKNRF
jgi:hypothetical protein